VTDILWRLVFLAVLASQVCLFVAFTAATAKYNVALEDLERTVVLIAQKLESIDSSKSQPAAVLNGLTVVQRPVVKVEDVEVVVEKVEGEKPVGFHRRYERSAYKDNRLPDGDVEVPDEPLGPIQNGNKSVPFHSVSYITVSSD
jgi:hypothetical protein